MNPDAGIQPQRHQVTAGRRREKAEAGVRSAGLRDALTSAVCVPDYDFGRTFVSLCPGGKILTRESL